MTSKFFLGFIIVAFFGISMMPNNVDYTLPQTEIIADSISRVQIDSSFSVEKKELKRIKKYLNR